MRIQTITLYLHTGGSNLKAIKELIKKQTCVVKELGEPALVRRSHGEPDGETQDVAADGASHHPERVDPTPRHTQRYRNHSGTDQNSHE